MAKVRIDWREHYPAVMKAMTSHGLLLGSYDAAGAANVMTIGWGAVGSFWGLPVWIVAVRPNRHTFRCIEHSACFTVNVPTEAMGLACVAAGNTSGPAANVWELAKVTPERARSVLAPAVAQCLIVYECHVVHAADVQPNRMGDEVRGMYVDEEMHRVYYGKIVETWAEPEARELLR
jgi:flavin reductase (DIM6/NTAB) family NADH-FMN oxidoreductase RutF